MALKQSNKNRTKAQTFAAPTTETIPPTESVATPSVVVPLLIFVTLLVILFL